MTLAKGQFPGSPTGRRVVVVYTSAADAGGESAAALGARLQQAGTILIVVGSVADSAYWPEAARATGGFFAPAGRPVVVPALDQVATTLRGRYLVQFPTPETLPARVSVRIDTGKLVLTGDVVIPARVAVGRGGQPGLAARYRVEIALAAAAIGVLLVIAVVLLIRRRGARPGNAPTATVVQGRVSVSEAAVRARAARPGGLAQGRAAVPGTGSGKPPSAQP